MNKPEKVKYIRQLMASGKASVGSWMQLSDGSVAEIMGQSGYDWVAVDLEHGSFSLHQLPDSFRALELGDTLPLVRLAQGHVKDCKQALDAGAAGVIVPMVESAEQLQMVKNACSWPPSGTRGVGFSRANLFGKNFVAYNEEAQNPFFVAMIEHVSAVENLESILSVKGLDAILVGPYDLSASMGMTGKFEEPLFEKTMSRILALCEKYQVPAGIHVVQPDIKMVDKRITEGYRFIAYSIDSVFLREASVFKR